MKARNGGCRLQIADAGCGRTLEMLLWRGDRYCGCRAAHQCRASGDRDSVEFVQPSPFTDPDVAARKLTEIASTIEPVQDGRIYIELVNAPSLKAGGTPDEYRAGIDRARQRL